MKCGLVYLSQESCLLGDVSYHSYEGIVVEAGERDRLGRDLGVHNKVTTNLPFGPKSFRANFIVRFFSKFYSEIY
jgi:hypothetical protein